MNNILNIKNSIKNDIDNVQSKYAVICKLDSLKLFLDSISNEIKEMILLGLSFREQLEVINKSSEFIIQYDQYLKYMKNYFIKKWIKPSNNNYSKNSQRNHDHHSNHGSKKKFSHEAMPNMNELY